MSTSREIIWFIHVEESFTKKTRQYVFKTIPDISYDALLNRIRVNTAMVAPTLTCNLGKEAPNVVINGNEALSIALKHYGNEAYTKGVHIRQETLLDYSQTHHKPSYNTQERQYVFYAYPNTTYRELVDIINKQTGTYSNELMTYSRGPSAPNVVINSDSALTMAISYYGDKAHTEGIHVYYGETK
ncbi:uncharacterized protein EV154DRAFT_480619 [Mucor mucedo]|uniref:uncharacterized protein n=1 Tax=Mucor mucedo TaxID=29922 RepID=UPI00221F1FA7|nr:uncharacterized protein EV154DRAFT_480619 [Mucor mucedo]KAI7892005.1 hypothetical protein EV154DRAFT_480619 [Mucor mucedo]